MAVAALGETPPPRAMPPAAPASSPSLAQRLGNGLGNGLSAGAARKLAVQGVFLATGVFSTCAAQFVFYEGAGDQRAMLLPLCNYLGMMLSGLVPVAAAAAAASAKKASKLKEEEVSETLLQTGGQTSDDEPECTGPRKLPDHAMVAAAELMELTRRQPVVDTEVVEEEEVDIVDESERLKAAGGANAPLGTPLQRCIAASVVLDFAGCLFSNVGLSMAGSGLFQVVYSSVICWSAMLSRCVLKKVVSTYEWTGIALVTFGLAFSALGESSGGRNNAMVLMGCFNTLIGAGFYGGNYVAGEYTLKLPERPQPRELCLKIGTACVAIIAVYQSIFVLPAWHALVTQPIAEAGGNTMGIFVALVAYTISQLAHGLTYFMLLGESGAVTTGIMQSLRAVCVFVISSLLYCSRQESQCFDTKRGVATLIVVSGVMFYSWAKGQTKAPQVAAAIMRKGDTKEKVVAGKNYVV